MLGRRGLPCSLRRPTPPASPRICWWSCSPPFEPQCFVQLRKSLSASPTGDQPLLVEVEVGHEVRLKSRSPSKTTRKKVREGRPAKDPPGRRQIDQNHRLGTSPYITRPPQRAQGPSEHTEAPGDSIVEQELHHSDEPGKHGSA